MQEKGSVPLAGVPMIILTIVLITWFGMASHATPPPAPSPTSTPLPPTIPTSVAQPPVPERILAASRASLGSAMWLRHSDLVGGGVFGCASSVSGVLILAGITEAASALVSTMRKQLLTRPGTQEIVLKTPDDPYLDDNEMRALLKPGDIMIGTMGPFDDTNAGAGAHTAVYVNENLVYSNNSDDGLWIEAPTHLLFDRFSYVEVLRLQ